MTGIKHIIRTAYFEWRAINASRLAAALAYYALLSFAPLIILIIAICGLVFKDSAGADVFEQTQSLLGPSGASAFESVVENAHRASGGLGPTLIASLTLLFGASGVVMELRTSLNQIWNAAPNATSMWRSAVKQRLASFAIVLALGLWIIASLVFSTAFAIVRKFGTTYVPILASVGAEFGNFILSTLALVLLFALILKLVPEVRIPWNSVFVGGVCCAVLFSIGKVLISVYLTKAAVGSTYGAAGSLVALVVWVYYSAQIFFFGAVLTKVYSESRSSRKAAL